MACTSIIYNNNIFSLDGFIDNVLSSKNRADIVPVSEIEEFEDHYSIQLYPYYEQENSFDIYYKNDFLILQVKEKNPLPKTLATKLFYMPDINTSKLSHIYYKDSLSLKIPKIQCLPRF